MDHALISAEYIKETLEAYYEDACKRLKGSMKTKNKDIAYWRETVCHFMNELN